MREYSHSYSAILFTQSNVKAFLSRQKEQVNSIYYLANMLRYLLTKSSFNKIQEYSNYLGQQENKAIYYLGNMNRLISPNLATKAIVKLKLFYNKTSISIKQIERLN